MQFEYLLFNLLVLAGPLSFSFERNIAFYRRWPIAGTAIVLTAIPFLIWDIAVTDAHWWFNPAYTLDFRIFGLPPGEWLFFVTIPYAGLFTWEVLKFRLQPAVIIREPILIALSAFCVVTGVFFLLNGKFYTGNVIVGLALVILLDIILRTRLFQQRSFFLLLMLSCLLTLIFDTYLTARPVVLYNPAIHLNHRIGTIPVEDFLYGVDLFALCVIVYQGILSRDKEADRSGLGR